jgi:hypothetical protein
MSSTALLVVNQRLSHAGLLLYHPSICTDDDTIEIHDDLFLVYGSVRNQISKCVYEAPIFIEHTLSQQGLMLLDGRSMTKILVLPRNSTVDTREYMFTDRKLTRFILDEHIERDSHHQCKYNEHKQFNHSNMSVSMEHAHSMRQTDSKSIFNGNASG